MFIDCIICYNLIIIYLWFDYIIIDNLTEKYRGNDLFPSYNLNRRT